MKRFYPLIDNGTGIIKAQYCYDALVALGGRGAVLGRVSQPYPTRSLNMATATFLSTDCEEMVVIDMDIHFTREDVDKLLSHDVPLVYGLYPKKALPLQWCVATLTDESPFGGDEPLVEVKRAGRGFMRVHRSVFEKMKPLVPEYHNHGRPEWQFWHEGCDNDGEWRSEDWWFCDNWRKLGGKVLVDQTICLQHIGDYSYGAPIPNNS
jgi:hypothetical protein